MGSNLKHRQELRFSGCLKMGQTQEGKGRLVDIWWFYIHAGGIKQRHNYKQEKERSQRRWQTCTSSTVAGPPSHVVSLALRELHIDSQHIFVEWMLENFSEDKNHYCKLASKTHYVPRTHPNKYVSRQKALKIKEMEDFLIHGLLVQFFIRIMWEEEGTSASEMGNLRPSSVGMG